MIYWEQFLQNRSIWVAVMAWAIAQVLKLILTYFTHRRVDLTRLYGAGGMPSSHTALVLALSVSVGKQMGFDSVAFAICLVLSFIVMYDAAGVRRAAGKQAAAINVLFNHAKLTIEEQLKELLGHTPAQVLAGAALGIFIGAFFG